MVRAERRPIPLGDRSHPGHLPPAVTSRTTLGAIEVSILTSPTTAHPGQPVEVLMRTFLPIPADDISVPLPQWYPAPTGLLFVLYPFPAYPFDVTAVHESGA